MTINRHTFRGILNDLGYYSGDEFESSDQVRAYLTVANLTDCIGEHWMTPVELILLADIAILYREHFAA